MTRAISPLAGEMSDRTERGAGTDHSIMIRVLMIGALYQGEPRAAIRFARAAHFLMHAGQAVEPRHARFDAAFVRGRDERRDYRASRA